MLEAGFARRCAFPTVDRDSLDLLPPLAAGGLARSSLAEVLAAAFRSSATGTLLLEQGGRESRLFLRRGRPCGGQLPGGFHNLGRHLVRKGLLDRQTLERTVKLRAATGRRHGVVLVAEGLLTPAELLSNLRELQRQNIQRLCLVRDARYELRGWERPPEWTEELDLDPLRVVIAALESEQLADRRRAVLAWLGDRPLRPAPDFDHLASLVALRPHERQELGTLAVPRAAAALGHGLLDATAEAFVAASALLGLLEPDTDEERFTPLLTPIDEPPAQPVALETGAELPTLEPIDEVSPGPDPIAGEAAGLDERRKSGAGAESTADEAAVGSTPASASRTPEEGAAAEAQRAELRRRLQRRGMLNLGPLLGRAAESSATAARAEETTPAPGETEAGRRGLPEPELEQEIRSRIARRGTEDHFSRLGLARTATTEEVREAFLLLARRFHPDRLSATGRAHLLGPARELFALIKESYDALIDPAARARYVSQLEATAGDARRSSKQRADEARLASRKAAVYLSKNDLESAEAELVRAVHSDPRAEYLAELAWTLQLNPRRRDEAREEIRQLVARALGAVPEHERAFVVAGRFARIAGDAARARRYFRQALERNPRSLEALRELRVLEMQAPEKKGAPDGDGLLGLFLKK
jgi:curved DNA-binding protein CbpA